MGRDAVGNRCLAIVGAGDHGRVIADLSLSAGQYSRVVFFDDSPKPKGSIEAADIATFGEWIAPVSALATHADKFDEVIVGIGDNPIRLSITQTCLEQGLSVATVIHPSAQVSRTASVGVGSVVLANAIINVSGALDTAVVVNSGVIVEHDCNIAAGAHLSPGAVLAGGVNVGLCSWIGAGAIVRQGCSIGANSIVGAGATVTRDLPDGIVAVGVPARVVRARFESD